MPCIIRMIKSKPKSSTWLGKSRNLNCILVRKSNRGHLLADLYTDGGLMKWILKKCDGRVSAGHIWLTRVSNGELL
jgi:hypothetical protein